MSTITWDDSYSIWDPELDKHHQQLIRYIHVLSEGSRHDPEVVQQLVKGLVAYAGYHFAAEEERMRESGYPDPEYSAHLASHRDFAKDVLIFEQVFTKGSPRLERLLLHYLTDWLTNHILTADKKLGAWLRDKRP
ncbi:MAG: bacteriohemerythrin [Myxococcota bacterium]